MHPVQTDPLLHLLHDYNKELHFTHCITSLFNHSSLPHLISSHSPFTETKYPTSHVKHIVPVGVQVKQ